MSTVLHDLNLPDPPLIDTPVARASACSHTDRPVKARGLCSPCYRAAWRAEKLAQELERARGERSVEKLAERAELEWDKDPDLKREFGRRMWEWLRAADVEPVYVERDGKRVRDWSTEIRLREMAQKSADKAATVLGKAYVTEKVEEVKPQPLPIGGAVDTSGWSGGGSESPDDEDDIDAAAHAENTGEILEPGEDENAEK